MKRTLIGLIVLAALTLAACAPITTTKALSPKKGAAYAAEVEDIVENLLVGFSEKDYPKTIRDCPVEFRDFWDESAFLRMYDDVIGKTGAYQSKTFDHAENRGWRRVVIYHIAFENNPDVLLEVYFDTPFDPVIVGFEFFNY